MVFTSPFFIFVFLPLVWFAWYSLRIFDVGMRGSLYLLCIASLVFYAWWHLPDLVLLAGSIVVNYYLGRAITQSGQPLRAWIVAGGVVANLLLLGVFKYWGLVTGLRSGLALPLAISFFTFTQIAFLVDSGRDKVRETSLLRYCAFVLFFPHLIAGPIVRLQEIQDQLTRCIPQSVRARHLYKGIGLILFGLAKKIFIADSLAPAANVLFGSTEAQQVSGAMAWIGVLCFYFQIYVDFSGYTDIQFKGTTPAALTRLHALEAGIAGLDATQVDRLLPTRTMDFYALSFWLKYVEDGKPYAPVAAVVSDICTAVRQSGVRLGVVYIPESRWLNEKYTAAQRAHFLSIAGLLGACADWVDLSAFESVGWDNRNFINRYMLDDYPYRGWKDPQVALTWIAEHPTERRWHFFDPDHMNAAGAKSFSQRMAPKIDAWSMPPHK